MAIKVVAFNGSPRQDGNTAQALKVVLGELKKEGIDTELVQLRPLKIGECTACGECEKSKDKRCVLKDDCNPLIEKMLAADGILMGSPTYFAGMASKLKALIDRAGMVACSNDQMLAKKVGAPVIAIRRQGATDVYHGICNFFAINSMFMVGSTYWNMAIGLEPGDVAKDDEGQETLRNLGQNMAWLLKKIKK